MQRLEVKYKKKSLKNGMLMVLIQGFPVHVHEYTNSHMTEFPFISGSTSTETIVMYTGHNKPMDSIELAP